jgi:hypothetical protein
MEKAAAVNPVVFVVVRNVIGHNIGFWFWLLGRLPYTCLYWFGWILFPKPFIRARAAVIFRNPCFAAATFRRLSSRKRRAQASARRGV